MLDQEEMRRVWFKTYIARVERGEIEPPQRGIRYPCPCCGYPTLTERSGYKICELCNWEDDGQDDPHADQDWGGPNGGYSLTEARNNFSRYFVMYRPGGSSWKITGENTPAERTAKRRLMAAFDAIPATNSQAHHDSLWQRVHACEDALRRERQRRISDSEAQVDSDSP